MSEMMRIQIDCSDVMMIVISLTLSGSLDSEKRVIEKELVSSLKNLFLIDLLMSCFLIFSVILMIQISAFSETLLSDSSKFSFLISAFLNFLDAVSIDFLILLADQNMCLCCSK